MSEAQKVFKRYELKYLLSRNQFDLLMKEIKNHIVPDEYGESTVCSLYYDTPDKLLIRRSLDKPEYKEKLRLRSYGVAGSDSAVFLELKKKYDEIVYKRRITTSLKSAEAYLSADKKIPFEGSSDTFQNHQIMEEIDYFRRFYGCIVPSMLLTYDRTAYIDRVDPTTRITFDRNILYREEDLRLDRGIYGTRIIGADQVLMELKVAGAIPLWLVKAMNQLKIYKTSFSKYGRAYQMSEQERMKICG